MGGVLLPDWGPGGAGEAVPAKITVQDFRRHHLQSFPRLVDTKYDALIQDSIDDVYAMFNGVATLWDMHRNKQVWQDKTVLCYRLLTAWYIAEKYPEMTAHIASIDGIRQKRIDGVSLAFDTGMINGKAEGVYQDALAALQSNHFGRTALLMIRSAPKRWLLRNAKVV
jgi:hypothetical protein